MEQEERKARFGIQLSRIRRLRRLSLDELARRSGISVSSLSSYERGGGNPTLETLGILSDTLTVPLSSLLGEFPELELRRLELECADEMLRFYACPDGRDSLQACLLRCTALLAQAMDIVQREEL